MKQEQIKALMVNILTGVVVLGVLVAAYFVFLRKDIPVVSSVASSVASVALIAEETALIGTEIDYTVRDLGDLAGAVASSNIVFELPAFKNLQDFTIAITGEPVGRANPFVPTAWKISLKEVVGGAASAPVAETPSVPAALQQPPAAAPIESQSQPPAALPTLPNPGI